MQKCVGLFLFKGDNEMTDQIKVITYNLNFIIKRIEKIEYEIVDYEVEAKIKELNEKVYELSDTLETIEVLLE